MKMNMMNMMIVNSPWPVIMCMNMMMMMTNLMMNMNKKFLMSTSILILTNMLVSFMWMKNSMMEKTMIGMKSNYNEMSMKTMILMIIMTETMFFLTFFYMNFSLSYFNNMMFNMKFNLNMFKLNFMLSFTNLMILLSSSMTLVISTHMNTLMKNKSLMYLNLTIMMGMYFVMIQSMEYYMLNFNLSNSIFFSNFFTLTMFHMSHVLMGTLIMMMMKNFKLKMLMSNQTKLKMMCWYWHFVDMIWVLIFVVMYTK
uniref:cytochrome c oxidase subunit III n=1 Tax=Ceroplastes floridensis TaxID=1182648 RepID=UPI00220C5583|nr:cytochrome c oxidase subunit III [Ceroplastes floridensis]UXW93677.1 cytochrome c oxidase subunit III [Ceroplastes floridensis]